MLPLEGTDEGLSSRMDSWIELTAVEENGERNRILYVIKLRGLAHSNQLREYRMMNTATELIGAVVGPGGVLTGAARITQEVRDLAGTERRRRQTARQRPE